MSKTVTFDYNGGTYTQKLKIKGTNMPWRYECDSSWIKVSTGATSLTLSVENTFNFRDRNGIIKIIDKFNNQLNLNVVQIGYRNLSVECASDVVISEEYYNGNNTFDYYITVYGGPTQKVICKDFDPYIEMVWDNSNLYNDFMIRIPHELKGNFTVRHSDADAYIQYCKENNIEYDLSKLEKNVTIHQVSKQDKIGEIQLEYNGNTYTNNDKLEVVIDNKNWIPIIVTSNEYIRIDSDTKCTVVNNRLMDLSLMAQWVDYTTQENVVRLKAKTENPFTARRCKVRLTNHTNQLQYMDISVVQNTTN